MWILGIDNEAIGADPLVVETQIALHAGETLLQFAVTEFFDRWSGEERSLAIGHPFKGWKVDVVGPDAESRMSEKKKQAKRAVISGSQRIPERERAILLGLFDYLSVLPESALVAAGVISVVDDAALEGSSITAMLTERQRCVAG